MKEPELVTFASNKSRIALALAHGADHLILEDPKLSLRSYEDQIHAGFKHLSDLAQEARSLNPNIQLSFNLDLLPQPHHDALITSLCTQLRAANISTIRIQDPGLKTAISAKFPQFEFHLATETGNQNLISLTYLSTHFKKIILSNELPQKEIKEFSLTLQTPFEIQVHGPILIQYSPRRFLANIESDHPENDKESRYRLAYDTAYPGRKYPFYDNPHGHLMYLYFDRCLLTEIPKLMDLNLTSWLIDGRGESEEYLSTALTLYKQHAQSYLENPTQYTLDNQDLDILQKTARRPLKPGFFRANLTDQDRKTPWASNEAPLATVLDFEKKKTMLLEIHRPISLPLQVKVITPKHLEIPLTLDNGRTLDHTPITTLQAGDLCIFPWHKGIPSQSRLYPL